MNKKGFTLIEMLVVIAIIAVLVSIIIPVVGNSTDKAAAATNAANLRAYKASLTTAYLSGDLTVDNTGTTATAQNGTTLPTAPTSEKCGKVEKGVTATFKFENNEFVVTFGTNNIEAFATVAAGGSSDALKEAKKS